MKAFLLLLLFSLAFKSVAQVQLWGACTQSDFTNESTAMGFDSDNNLYVTGYITGESAFNANVTFNSAQGNGDIYVAKYSPTGTLLWVKKFGGSMSDRGYGIKIDNNGDILVAGQYFGNVDFGGNVLQSVSNSKDIFLIKMNPQGDVLWAVSEGGSMGDNMYALTVDAQNNIILTGQFAGSATIAGQAFTSVINPDLNESSYDIFVSKYDSSGSPLWAIHGAAKYEDRGMALGTDGQNNIYLAGQFSDTLQLAGQTFNNAGYNAGFITKLSTNGTIQWFNRMSGGMVLPYDLVVGSDNQITICGDFLGNLMHQGTNGLQTLTHDYDRKVFVSTVNAAGHVLWQRALGSDNEISARGIARDNNNQIYVTGHFRCALTELQENNTALFNSVGFRDIYLWTLNATGSSLQNKQMGGKKNDYAYDIQVNSLGQPFICGSYMNHLYTPNSPTPVLLNQNSFNLTASTGWYFLQGDESANSFISGALHSNTSSYNYFINQPNDSLEGFISLEDTVYFCDQGNINYNTQTFASAGPGYNFLWNNGLTTQNISVNQTGEYSVFVERWDACVDKNDTVQVVVNLIPEMPLLSDDIVQYTDVALGICLPLEQLSVKLHLCAPDSVLIWFTPIAPDLTFTVSGPQTNFDTTDPNMYYHEGVYSATISSPYCSQTRCFGIIHDTILEKEIDPKPLFVDTNIISDTLTICAGESTPINVIDLLSNPLQDSTLLPTVPVVDEIFTITVNGSPVSVVQYPNYPNPPTRYRAKFFPTVTGWYILDYELTTGYNNTCGIDTMYNQRFDSLYIIVNPLPTYNTTLDLGSLLCPNGSVFLTSSNALPNFSWSGPSIDWLSTNTDSVQVSSSGVYNYSGTIVDSITSCSDYFIFQIFLPEKVPPTISLLPEDAIVCPYDSVLMSVPSIYVNYNWTGPSGTDLSQTNTHLDAEMGFYYCTVLDDEGCYLTTPPVEIQEFATPYLFVEPTNVICPGQQLEITAVFMGSGSVNWLAPLSGSAPTQTVSLPGWYKAELTACGITIIDSVLITDGSFIPTISASDTLLCSDQQITISGTPANAYFQWSNGFEGMNNIQITEPGNYFATVTNDFGCVAQTNTISINPVLGSEPPNSYTVTLCEPSNLTLETDQNIAALWFDENYSLLDSAFTYGNFFSTSTTIYAAYPQDYCPLVYGTIEVILLEPISPNMSIIGDSALCYNSTAEYTTDWAGDISWALNGNFYSNDQTISFYAASLVNSNLLTATLENACHSLTVSTEIVVHQQQTLTPSFYDTTVCANSQFPLIFSGYFPEIYVVDNATTGTYSSILVSVADQPESFQFYALDSNNCLSDTVAVNIYVYTSDFHIHEVYVPLCTPDTLILSTNVNTPVSWEFYPDTYMADTLFLALVDAGDYYISAQYSDSNGCTFNDQINILIYNPNEYALPDTMVCIGETIYTEFSVEIVNGVMTFVPTDSIQVTSSMTLTYTVNNNFGCPYTHEINIEAIDCQADLPNVITPNGDGINDVFFIKTTPLEPNNHLLILNRWGNVVYEENGYNNTFSGDNCVDGVYFYLYTPNSEQPENGIVKGQLHILRGK